MSDDLGLKISNRRKELNLTMEDVARAVGVGKSTVSKWERGAIKDMRRDKIAALASVLQMDPVEFINDDFVDPDDVASARRVPPPGYDTPEIALMLKCMSDLSPEDQKRLLDIGRLAFPVAFNKKLEEKDK